MCRLGDRNKLKEFLTDHDGIDLDVKCQDGKLVPTAHNSIPLHMILPGTTVLNEAVTKTAQFTGIVEVLLDFGARIDVR